MKKRVLSAVICAVICFVLVFSLDFAAENTIHKCTGAGCKICLEIDECILLVHSFIFTAASVFILSAAVMFAEYSFSFIYRSDTPRCTLVSLKVKLSD